MNEANNRSKAVEQRLAGAVASSCIGKWLVLVVVTSAMTACGEPEPSGPTRAYQAIFERRETNDKIKEDTDLKLESIKLGMKGRISNFYYYGSRHNLPVDGMIHAFEFRELKVLQIINEAELLLHQSRPALVRVGSDEPVTVWVEGISTKGMVDGSKFSVENTFEVTDTRSYDSTGGARRTVFVLTATD